MRLLITLCFFFLLSFSCFSQTTIEGYLKTENRKSIVGASVIIKKIDSSGTYAYDISDINGYFSITLYSKPEQLHLNIRAMGYKSVTEVIDNKSQTKNIVLIEQATKLKEVVIKSRPITHNGDTINYSVDAFSKLEDRTIGDVLKNMPGIEVLSDGKILYLGRPINKYYIEGMDLLEGKYNLANNNLPFKEVSRVQVLENHQPIKILDSLVSSEQAAINIKLKNKYTFTGQAELGSGFNPLLWNVNITPMLFSKKQQMISSYQANNSGDDLSLQLKTFTLNDLLEQFERNDEKKNWLDIVKLREPSFSKSRWLDNNTHLITTNYLQKLKSDYELRLNVSYLNDYQQRQGFTNTRFLISDDTIAIFENKYNQLFTNTLETTLTLQKNIGEKFLKNTIQFQGFWDSQRGRIDLNTNNVLEDLSNKYFKLSNNFKTLFPLGKQVLTLNSYFTINRTPQYLSLNPGQFKDLLNNGNDYDEVTQEIDLQTFYTNNSLTITKGFKQFSFSPKIGIQFEKQNLGSTITTVSTQNNDKIFTNNLDWIRSKIYFDLRTQYKKNKWRVELTTPINLYDYSLEDTNLKSKQDVSRLTFEPKLSVNYDLNSFWHLKTSANISNQFGAIQQVYYAYILQNYRNIKRIDAPLPQKHNLIYSASIGYRNPIKSIFINLIYSNSTTEKNLLYDRNILENGAIVLQAIANKNKRLSHNLMMTTSKYLSNIKTNLSLSTNYSFQDVKQIINSEITDIANQNWLLTGKIDTDISDWLNTEIISMWQFSNNRIQGQDNQTIKQQLHKLNVNIYPNENQYFAIRTEYIKNNLFSEAANNLFADLIYRYSWKKKNIDFEVKWNNIFNTNNYRTVNINNISYIETNFLLRPSQLLFKVGFSL
ncbi:carboxypeptidase-like regulatory domain-containing protein [Aureibaculum conchae]|uniref:carboxypeptidase-like regulatory domain-containing protein n=1 Tax=Aureibaculum sp. 2308TA14-22 TaxID=3108392 RepID=UPI003397D64F